MRVLLRRPIGGHQLSPGGILVELDVFSGRPNPRWQLDQESEGALRRLIDGLAIAQGNAAPTPPGLGYRGVRITGPEGSSQAYGGYVEAPDGVRADPGRHIERFLLEHLPAELAYLRPVVEAELGGAEG